MPTKTTTKTARTTTKSVIATLHDLDFSPEETRDDWFVWGTHGSHAWIRVCEIDGGWEVIAFQGWSVAWKATFDGAPAAVVNAAIAAAVAS
jgi:hypothetical protein